jgi:CIC family chloride channel protein
MTPSGAFLPRILVKIRRLMRLISNAVFAWSRPHLSYIIGQRLPLVWALSIVAGISTAIAAIAFREMIGAVQWLWLGTRSEVVLDPLYQLDWYTIVVVPTLGGLLVGLFLQYFHPDKRAGNVVDVIEARALHGRRLTFRKGLASALASSFSLGIGASAGREGPVVHLGAMLSDTISRYTKLPPVARRKLLACGVAGAISASFNAPIAGVLFAHEVILGHYALSAFMPIVLASTSGAVIGRLWFGDIAAFTIPDYAISSYWEFPAFALLGLACAAVAILFQFALIWTDMIARIPPVPFAMRPMIGGFCVGLMALIFPHVLGVGYEATDMALQNQMPFYLMFSLIIAKTLATAISQASRLGGGIFSPALFIGAMTGGSFGVLASAVFPHYASSEGLYAILGMGAVAAAVLGAPVSTVMIVFELTGGYTLSVALLLCVSIATGLTAAVHGKSFFDWQLKTRGIILDEGPHKYLLKSVSVQSFMASIPEDQKPEPLAEGQPFLTQSDTLETALKLFEESNSSRIAVVSNVLDKKVIGHADQIKALSNFNRILVESSVEEHK